MFIDLEKSKDAAQSDAESLSPFVFRKISLAHLEVDQEVTLKFRRATFLDHDYFREKYGVDAIQNATQDILSTVAMIYRFLSKESRRELSKIKFTDINDKGEEVPVNMELFEIFKNILVSSVNAHQDLFDLFLEIFGYTKEQLELMQKGVEETKKKAKQKHLNKTKQSHSS